MTPATRLTLAKNLLMTGGWIKHFLKDEAGRHCALGAIASCAEPINSFYTFSWTDHPVGDIACKFLYDAIPAVEADQLPKYSDFEERSKRRCIIADYNNSRDNFDQIADWFDRAIDLAKAAEMWRELESVQPTEIADTVEIEQKKEETVNVNH